MHLTKTQVSALKKTGVNCSDSLREKISYSSDASLLKKPADIVFWPKEKKEVTKLVKACYENDVPITPRGAGTGLAGGAVPTGVVIDLSRLNDVHVLPEEKKAIVEPGAILFDINHHAEQHRLWFPVIPSSEKVCTIGGMISTNAVGLRAVKYGRTSDWVQELTVINGKGEIVKLSGNKAKDFCGTEGTLGIIIEAVLNLTEKKEEESLTLKACPSIDEVIKTVLEEKDKASFLEYICPLSSQLAGLQETHHLMIGYQDTSGEITSPEKIKELTTLRESLGPLRASAGYTLIEDPWVPEEGLKKVLNWLMQNKIPTVAHIGCGILHPRFSEENKNLVPKLHALVMSVNGLASGEHGYGIKKVKYVPDEFKQKLKKLKEEYDPKGIMNPGKIISVTRYSKSSPLDDCVQCGLCKTCPVYLTELNESIGSRGRAILFNDMDDLEAFYSCTLCKSCDQVCPTGLKLSEKILEKRKRLVKQGKETQANRKMIENVRRYGNPFGEPGTEVKDWYCC